MCRGRCGMSSVFLRGRVAQKVFLSPQMHDEIFQRTADETAATINNIIESIILPVLNFIKKFKRREESEVSSIFLNFEKWFSVF